MKALKICGKVVSAIITVILVLVIAFNLTNLILRKTSDELQPRLFGFSSAVIISGSMEPTIMVNDLAIYKEKDDYQVGDIIIFENFGGENLTTHRIVEISPDGYITRGDANNANDLAPVPREKVYGALFFIIPQVGVISEFMFKPISILTLVLLGFAVIMLPTLFSKGD